MGILAVARVGSISDLVAMDRGIAAGLLRRSHSHFRTVPGVDNGLLVAWNSDIDTRSGIEPALKI